MQPLVGTFITCAIPEANFSQFFFLCSLYVVYSFAVPLSHFSLLFSKQDTPTPRLSDSSLQLQSAGIYDIQLHIIPLEFLILGLAF